MKLEKGSVVWHARDVFHYRRKHFSLDETRKVVELLVGKGTVTGGGPVDVIISWEVADLGPSRERRVSAEAAYSATREEAIAKVVAMLERRLRHARKHVRETEALLELARRGEPGTFSADEEPAS